MKLDHFTHWVFDLDGTLAHSQLDFPSIKQRLGLASDRGILEQLAHLPKGERCRISEQLAAIEWEHAGKAIAAPGASQLLCFLREKTIPLGILTRNRKDIALRTLQVTGLAEYFEPEAVLGRDEALPKPSPDGLLQLFTTWGASPYKGVMAGDFRFDLEAGRSAGCLTIYVDPGEDYPHEDLADVKVASLEQLLIKFE